MMAFVSARAIKFQSTHPRGVRQRMTIVEQKTKKFQSTHPRGVRHIMYAWVDNWTEISIHAPTRGATDEIVVFGGLRENFNPRTHEGCDQFLLYKPLEPYISIHAPTRGATQVRHRSR